MNFTRRDFPTIMSGWVVRYQLDSDRLDGEISASRDGVSLRGTFPAITDPADIEILIATIRRAQIHYQHLCEERVGLFARPHTKPLPEEMVDRLLETQIKRAGQLIDLSFAMTEHALLWTGPGVYHFDVVDGVWVKKPE